MTPITVGAHKSPVTAMTFNAATSGGSPLLPCLPALLRCPLCPVPIAQHPASVYLINACGSAAAVVCRDHCCWRPRTFWHAQRFQAAAGRILSAARPSMAAWAHAWHLAKTGVLTVILLLYNVRIKCQSRIKHVANNNDTTQQTMGSTKRQAALTAPS